MQKVAAYQVWGGWHGMFHGLGIPQAPFSAHVKIIRVIPANTRHSKLGIISGPKKGQHSIIRRLPSACSVATYWARGGWYGMLHSLSNPQAPFSDPLWIWPQKSETSFFPELCRSCFSMYLPWKVCVNIHATFVLTNKLELVQKSVFL